MTLLLCLSATVAYADDSSGSAASDSAIESNLAAVQIPFIKNQGQIEDPAVKFYVGTFAGTASVTDKGITYSHSKDVNGETQTSEVQENLVGAKGVNPVGAGQSQTSGNWYIGDDSSKWRTNIPAYNQVSLGEVYDGIELSLKAYGNNIEKIFTIQPGGDPQDIRLTIDGADSLLINKKGELEIGTDLGNVQLTSPIAYQEIDGKKVDVAVKYDLQGSNSYGFELGDYNPAYPLVIDPLLAGVFSSATEGMTNGVYHIPIVASSDYVYVGGYINTASNRANVAVYKFSKDLKTVLNYSVLGGSNDDYVNGMALDTNGNIFIVGSTSSCDYKATTRFPSSTTGVYSNALSTTDTSNQRRSDVFVVKLSGDSLTTLALTTFGSTYNDYGDEIALDSQGNVIITVNSTYNSSDLNKYPNTSSNANTNIAGTALTSGKPYIVVTKLKNDLSGGSDENSNPITTSPIASTFLGIGTGNGHANIAICQDKIYVGSYIPGTSVYPLAGSSYDSKINDGVNTSSGDGVISRLSNDLGTLEAGTFLGGNGSDMIYDLAVDSDGNIYATGLTSTGGGFLIDTGCIGSYATSGTATDMYVLKLNADLSSLLGSALFGSTSSCNEFGTSLALSNDSVYVAGQGSSTFPTTAGAYKTTLSASPNIVVLKLDKAFTIYTSSFICQGTVDTNGPCAGIAFDADSNLLISGNTAGSSVPITITPTVSPDYGTWPTSGAALFKMSSDLLSYWPVGSTLTVPGKTPTSVDLSWTASNAPSNRILKDNTVIDTVSGVTTYRATGLTPNTAYTFKVEAGDSELNNWTIDGPSLTITTENDTTPPTWPSPGNTITVSGVTSSGLTLSWPPATDNTAVTGYKVFQDSVQFASVNADVLSYTISGLTEGTQYTFKIEAGDMVGNWSENGPVKTLTVELQVLTWPQGSSLTVSNVTANRLTLNWTAADDNIGVASYKIYQDEVLIGTVPASMWTYNVTGLTANTPYTFKVEAGDDVGNWSTDGPSVTVSEMVRPTWPTGSTITAVDTSSSELTLTWSAATDNMAVTGYRIYQDGVLLDTVVGTEYNVTNLSASTTYTFKVEAGDAAGNWSTNGPSVTKMTAAVSISLTLNKNVVSVGDTITASGKANPVTWVTVKMLDSMQNILFVDSIQSDEVGNYIMDLQIPTDANGPLTVVAGYGSNVATCELNMAGNPEALAAKIADATVILNGAVEGTDFGKYAVGSKSTLQTAINAAQAVLETATSKSQVDLDTATTVLNEALAAFEAGKVTTVTEPKYIVTAANDDNYNNGQTADGIIMMTVQDGISGFKYFSVNITSVSPHEGSEVVVFVHLRDGIQLAINATKADFDMVNNAEAGFNIKSGDVVKAYIVDDLTNAVDRNPVILQ